MAIPNFACESLGQNSFRWFAESLDSVLKLEMWYGDGTCAHAVH